jgi:hypothetical protein
MKNKSLNFVYNWIGPRGPLPNHKTPDIYDLAKKMSFIAVDCNTITEEHDTIAYSLKEYVDCNFIASYQVKENDTFIFEIVLSPKNHYLQNTLQVGSGFLETSAIDNKIINLIKHKNGYFLLSSYYESFVDVQDFNQIHNYFNYHNIPLEKVIYVTNCYNVKEKYNEYCWSIQQSPRLQCEYLNLYLLDQSNLAKRDDIKKYNPDLRNKKKLFLNWNRRIKSHRTLFLLFAIRKNFIGNTFMSFSNLHTSLDLWISDAYKLSVQFNLNFTKDELIDIYHNLPFVLDSENFNRFPIEDDIFSTATWYDQSYISIVSETNFDNNIIHMTEKTIKPILFKQPFIIIGPQGTLASLKELGFKTFSDFWDESYDESKNSKERFLKIIEVCDYLSSWSKTDLFKFFAKSKEITEHNFKVMQKLKPINVLQFLKKYGS